VRVGDELATEAVRMNMARYCVTEAIIIRNQDFRETDKMVTFFARREGKLRAIAKGTRKPNSSLRPTIQPFCHSCLHLSQGRELDIITQGRIIEFFGNVREETVKMAHGVYLMELLDRGLAESDPHPKVFDAALTVLRWLDDRVFSPLAIRWFEVKLVQELGYGFNLQECAQCGAKQAAALSVELGGILCDSCKQVNRGAAVLSLEGETWALLKDLEEKEAAFLQRVRPSTRAMQEVELILEKYLEYHLGQKFNTKSIVRSLMGR